MSVGDGVRHIFIWPKDLRCGKVKNKFLFLNELVRISLFGTGDASKLLGSNGSGRKLCRVPGRDSDTTSHTDRGHL